MGECVKRFIVFLLLFFCSAAHAETETINWYMGDNIYATTTCESGGDITLPTTPTKYGYTFQGWSSYVPIEYLESTGTQWIDTGVVGDTDFLRIVFEFETKSLQKNWQSVFGSYVDENTAAWRLVISSQKIGYINTNTQAGQGMVGYNFYNEKKYFVDLKYKSAEINGENFVFDAPHGNTNNQTILLYDSNNHETTISARIYYFQIYDNDILVRDFVPALDQNGVPCMYDRVEQKYYYNAGTGDFIAGPIIGE